MQQSKNRKKSLFDFEKNVKNAKNGKVMT